MALLCTSCDKSTPGITIIRSHSWKFVLVMPFFRSSGSECPIFNGDFSRIQSNNVVFAFLRTVHFVSRKGLHCSKLLCLHTSVWVAWKECPSGTERMIYYLYRSLFRPAGYRNVRNWFWVIKRMPHTHPQRPFPWMRVWMNHTPHENIYQRITALSTLGIVAYTRMHCSACALFTFGPECTATSICQCSGKPALSSVRNCWRVYVRRMCLCKCTAYVQVVDERKHHRHTGTHQNRELFKICGALQRKVTRKTFLAECTRYACTTPYVCHGNRCEVLGFSIKYARSTRTHPTERPICYSLARFSEMTLLYEVVETTVTEKFRSHHIFGARLWLKITEKNNH